MGPPVPDRRTQRRLIVLEFSRHEAALDQLSRREWRRRTNCRRLLRTRRGNRRIVHRPHAWLASTYKVSR
jgi:hypothetical protein